jgi:N-acetylglucosamine malate deacetylase 1
MKIIAVFAHPDDEVGCASTLAKHAARGDEVLLVWTTYGENASHFVGVAADEVKRVRHGHGEHIAKLIGGSYRFFDFGDTRMTGDRAEALEIARLYCEFRPDAIITWDDFNRHPDHRAVAKIAFDAITLARIPKVVQEGGPEGRFGQLEAHRGGVSFYQYACPESTRTIVHTDISDHAHVGAESLEFFAQFYGWKTNREDWLQGRANAGRLVGVKYAEKFTVEKRFHPPLEFLV